MIRINRSGLLYILFSIFLGVAATNTGNNLLFVVSSLILGFMGASGFFGKKNLDGIEAQILNPKEVYANLPSFLKVRLRNRKRFIPSFILRVRIGEKEGCIPILEPNAEREIEIPFLCEKRGMFKVDSIEVSSVFPLGLFKRFKRIKTQASFIVYPEPKKARISFDSFGEFGNPSEKLQNVTNYEVSGLRDYNLRDPLRLIHWKASAKTGKLRTKKLESGNTRELFIDFDGFPVQDLEERIKIITYIVVEAAKNGLAVGMRINGKRIEPSADPSNKFRILRELALYGNS